MICDASAVTLLLLGELPTVIVAVNCPFTVMSNELVGVNVGLLAVPCTQGISLAQSMLPSATHTLSVVLYQYVAAEVGETFPSIVALTAYCPTLPILFNGAEPLNCAASLITIGVCNTKLPLVNFIALYMGQHLML